MIYNSVTFLNNKNNIKLYYTYKKNKYFINLEKNTSTQSFILEINSAERSFSTVKLNCQNSKSEIVIVMLPKYVSALLAEEIDLSGYFLTVCIYRNFSFFYMYNTRHVEGVSKWEFKCCKNYNRN